MVVGRVVGKGLNNPPNLHPHYSPYLPSFSHSLCQLMVEDGRFRERKEWKKEREESSDDGWWVRWLVWCGWWWVC